MKTETLPLRCICDACCEAHGRIVLECGYVPADSALLSGGHYVLIRTYEPLEVYDHKGSFWTCPAVRVSDYTIDGNGFRHEIIAPASWFEAIE